MSCTGSGGIPASPTDRRSCAPGRLRRGAGGGGWRQVKVAAREVRGKDFKVRRPGRGVALATLLLLSAAALLLARFWLETTGRTRRHRCSKHGKRPPPPPQRRPLRRLRRASAAGWAGAALALWQSPAPEAPGWDCPDLSTLGLACEAGALPLWQLLAQNRPALLGLKTPERWVLLTATRGTALARRRGGPGLDGPTGPRSAMERPGPSALARAPRRPRCEPSGSPNASKARATLAPGGSNGFKRIAALPWGRSSPWKRCWP